jgi:hypothetical protein
VLSLHVGAHLSQRLAPGAAAHVHGAAA